MDPVTELVAKTFPFIEPDEVEKILDVCAKNDGLVWTPENPPTFVFGYFWYRPEAVSLVDAADWGTLYGMDLRMGPVLHIAVLITPTSGYQLTRALIDELNPRGVSCHRRRKDGSLDFRFTVNPRFQGESYAGKH